MAGLTAGCSSGVARFGNIDNVFTASTNNQRSIIGEKQQPFPGDSAPAPQPSYSNSAARTAVEPVPVTSGLGSSGGVERQTLSPVAAAPQPQPAPAALPEARSVARTEPSAPRSLSPLPATTVADAPAPRTQANARQGWSTDGAATVTVREGETLYNLSKRFGVPVNDIVRANNLAGPDQVRVGQKIVIPTYQYAQANPVSAPDANPNVAEAKSSRGTHYDIPADRVPVPNRAPEKNLAVLPQTPKPRDAVGAERLPTVSPDTTTANAKPAAPAAAGGYTVGSGDSLYTVARKHGTTVEAVRAANNLSSPTLKIGQKLIIPAAGQKSVDPVKTAAVAPKAEASKSNTYTPPKRAEKAINEIETDTASVAPGATGIGKMRWPVRGRVVSSFGQGGGSTSDGIDIAVPEGTAVKAAENGVVIYAGNGLKEFGNTVLVRHDDGLVTVYGHASEIKVSRGDKVKRGQDIAASGMSGSADSPKLHFEVRKNSAPVDPSKFLE